MPCPKCWAQNLYSLGSHLISFMSEYRFSAQTQYPFSIYTQVFQILRCYCFIYFQLLVINSRQKFDIYMMLNCETLLLQLLSVLDFFVDSLGFSIENDLICKYRELCFLWWDSYGILALFPILGKKHADRCSPLSMPAIKYMYMSFAKNKGHSSIPGLLRPLFFLMNWHGI